MPLTALEVILAAADGCSILSCLIRLVRWILIAIAFGVGILYRTKGADWTTWLFVIVGVWLVVEIVYLIYSVSQGDDANEIWLGY